MKTKVIIENSETTIILTPENKLERDVIEKMHENRSQYSVYTPLTIAFSEYSDHKIEICIKEVN